MRRAALHTLGCKVNSYETEAMKELLENAGYEIVDFNDTADVYIINTCSVTNVADKKSRQMLHRAKAKNPDAIVVAAGCYVQAAGEKLLEDAAIDLVIGNNRKTELVPLLEERFAGLADTESIIDIGATGEYEALHITNQTEHTRAFIKIQDGCNQFCSYCIIPYTRGRVRSRRPEDIETEVKTLASRGFREIVLTGIHLTSYGIDFPKSAAKPGNVSEAERSADTDGAVSETGEKIDLLSLIKRLHAIDGIERIRFGSLEPRVITEEFARELSALPKVCPHFHLSLQSGCDATLRRMNRHYTCEDYAARCEILRKYFKNPAITTDVIVGFPGETEEEFSETAKFLERVHFYEMHVFKYSRREGTRADRMPDQIPEPEKTRRSALLLELERRMSREYRESFLGTETTALLEEEITVDGERYMLGHTREYVKVAVPVGEGPGRIPESAGKNCFYGGIPEKFLTDEILVLQKREK